MAHSYRFLKKKKDRVIKSVESLDQQILGIRKQIHTILKTPIKVVIQVPKPPVKTIAVTPVPQVAIPTTFADGTTCDVW